LGLRGTDLTFQKAVNTFTLKFWPWKQYGEYGQYEDGGHGFQGHQNKNNNILVKVNKLVYLGSEINSGWKIR
jgi:hypothetical protein